MENLQQVVASITLMIVVVGCLGNLLSLFVFLRHASSVNTLLAALSIVDLCLLLFAVPVFVLPSLNIWSSQDSLIHFLAYVLKFVYPINLMLQTCSVYIMVLITMERWTAVCRPLQVRIWCTARATRIALLFIAIFAIAYNMIRFWEYSITETPTGKAYVRELRDIEKHPNYMIGYYTGLYLLTHFLIPFGIIIVMNGHVCKSIIMLRRARQMLTRQQQREQSTTYMLLLVTLIFALCNTLPFLLNLAECFKPDLFEAESTSWIAYQLNDLSNLLVVFNSATTFIIYLAFSAKYRQRAAYILIWRCCRNLEKDVKYNSLASRSQSIRANTNNSSIYHRSSQAQVQIEKQRMNESPTQRDALLKPLYMAKRSDRAVSEYNERIKRVPLASISSAATGSGPAGACTPANLEHETFLNGSIKSSSSKRLSTISANGNFLEPSSALLFEHKRDQRRSSDINIF
uniref:G-protein coupled receptors family 1 profile domain-containing protein n=1 Tax=Acrobeloides nanus TaxID=290746 RepID=A0A914C4L7_9BILA